MVTKLGDSFIPERGNVVRLNFDPKAGHEQGKMRPAIVISPRRYNEKSNLIICCPVTSKAKGYPFEVSLPHNIKTCEGNSLHGVILSDQVKCLDWKSRNAEYLCTVPSEVVNEVLQKLALLLT